jgi:hypothetical protein
VGDTIRVRLDTLAAGGPRYLYLAASPVVADPDPTDLDRVISLAASLAPRQSGQSYSSATVGTTVGYYAYLPEDHLFRSSSPPSCRPRRAGGPLVWSTN